ncbi:M28 family peptidase, partial [bacterium]|nr:M28 family peptidase [bacterium]
VRLAGTRGEARAADYIAEAYQRGGGVATIEEFPMHARDVRAEELSIRVGGRWRRFGCSLLGSTPGTNGKVREAPLVFFEAPAEYNRPDLSDLRGKAVVHLGCHIESRASYRRLMAARPAFLLFVDIRHPGAVPLGDGMFPAYTQALGAVPTVNVAYLDAWAWRTRGATAARLRVAGGMQPSVSQNVIAELPAPQAGAPVLFLGAHHDTQAGTVGADDNATGVAGLLELARVLAPLPRRRAIRLISFGTEEQLSVGSAAYARRHRRELAQRGQLIFNLDSFGSPLGWGEVVVNGSDRLVQTLRAGFAAAELYPRFLPAVVPYSDHFPFAAAGVPAAWLWRPNCTAGHFYHHRPDNDLSRVSPPTMASWLDAIAAIIQRLANARTLPFPRTIPADQARAAAVYWRDLYGGWRG